MRDFIVPEYADVIKEGMKRVDDKEGLGEGKRPKEGYEAGVGGGWKVVGPSHKQRYLEYEGEGKDGGVGDKLKEVRGRGGGRGEKRRGERLKGSKGTLGRNDESNN